MKKIQSLASVLILIVLLVSIGFITLSFKSDETNLMVIANEKGAPGNLSLKELKAIAQGDKQRWPDGTKVMLAFMKTSTTAGDATARKLLNMSGDQFNKHWLALVFQGKAKAPQFFNTVQDLDNYVHSNPGAIGIVDANQSTNARSITVDDKKSF